MSIILVQKSPFYVHKLTHAVSRDVLETENAEVLHWQPEQRLAYRYTKTSCQSRILTLSHRALKLELSSD